MRRTVFALLLVAGAAGVAPAQKGREIHPCEGHGSQAEATACAGKEYRAADAELNRVYKQLMSKLDAGEQDFLKKAETAWIKYRDAQCEYEDSFYAGGTMRPMITAFCMARVTKARTAELRLQLKNLEDR
ncbi:MAG TPA: lysozyme inhibitor LprI family protein [Pyrinomonadaceae bacterium]|jgi:uncharacterized protein YecT (DUF1311 family)|nr:lysozyme inhibitor LprI family protein [Pyrinomonadaceae bacterium]